MQARFIHRCTHVLDLEATKKFYEKALGFRVVRVSGPEDGSWSNTFMANDAAPFELELTWNRGRTEPYDNGGRDTHIAFAVDDFEAYHELHRQMASSTRRIPRWGSTSSAILTGRGSRSFLRNKWQGNLHLKGFRNIPGALLLWAKAWTGDQLDREKSQLDTPERELDRGF